MAGDGQSKGLGIGTETQWVLRTLLGFILWSDTCILQHVSELAPTQETPEAESHLGASLEMTMHTLALSSCTQAFFMR